MAWRDQLEQGSFRGVPFHTERTSGKVGRRVQVVEYPLRDMPLAEDLGRKARTFTIDAFILGADYITGRDALIDALETPGPGELVHRYRGRQNVVVVDATIEETPAEGGMVRFSIEFSEAGANRFPASRVDAAAQLQSAADKVTTAARSDFSTSWLPGSSGAVLQAAQDTANSAFAWIDQHLGVLSDAQSQLDNLISPVQSLISQPEALFQRLVGSLERIRGRLETPFTGTTGFENVQLPNAARQTMADVAPLMNADLPSSVSMAGQSVATPTAATVQIAANHAAMQSALQTIAAIQVASSVADLPAVASADLEEVRDQVLQALDTQATIAGDGTYLSLLQLKSAVGKAVADRLPGSQSLLTTRTYSVEPSLVLAWRCNGDLGSESDLVQRNRISHPGFVPSGKTLNVLLS